MVLDVWWLMVFVMDFLFGLSVVVVLVESVRFKV